MLVICAYGLWLRLSSTLWLKGYLALNTAVEVVFQATDACSRFLMLRLLAAAYSEGYAAKRVALDILRAPSADKSIGAVSVRGQC